MALRPEELMDAIAAFAGHVVRTTYDDLPDAAVAAAKTLILDSLGVGVVGSAGPWADELVRAAGGWGRGEETRVWVRGARLPAPAAALCNAYQVHNSEFDCIHERAVVHPMAVLLPAALAHAERAGGVAGRDLLTAVALGVDVGASLGVASRAPLRFFRPATAGAFAATAAIGKLMGFDEATLVNAFGAVLGQVCGTMQAHSEGSLLLALQIGFNARNALVACDLAANGLRGPRHLLEGPFGYYALFEGEHDLDHDPLRQREPRGVAERVRPEVVDVHARLEQRAGEDVGHAEAGLVRAHPGARRAPDQALGQGRHMGLDPRHVGRAEAVLLAQRQHGVEHAMGRAAGRERLEGDLGYAPDLAELVQHRGEVV
ncbi:MAG TPA: MmgE/PrpD family protein, partial [Geminicoccaceae bacterium]|nr:MmgE/PrpD family protein [Geminicoccaceae bacterium]